MALDQLKQDRIKKLNNIKNLGVDPYPATLDAAQDRIAIGVARDSMDKKVMVAGRIRSLRPHGKIAFADLEDESGKMQLFFQQDTTQNFDFLPNLDIGDFMQVSGEVFKTQAGEITVRVSSFKLLTKSLLPLPSDWYGLKDTEERLRKRYLDLLLNPEVKDLFRKKALFWSTIRQFMLDRDFLEVDMPILENVPGGADARPFITHHNALDIDLYLRISLELPLKRLLVGGYEKVFEIGRIFRNEGIDAEHLQDYTQLEFYWAYADYNDLMKLVQEMYQKVIMALFGKLETTWQGQTIDWSGNWPKKSYTQLLNEHWGVDIEKMSVDDLYGLAKKHQVAVEPNLGKGRLLDYIYKKTIRPKLIQPMFVVDYPVEVEPLAKRIPEKPNLVQRMQVLAMGSELGKGFSELNDPLDQRERFEEQMKLRAAGDDEAQMMDEDYVEAMEYGMPPNTGFGISERLFSMLMDRPIRETVIFPTMRFASAKASSDKQNFEKKMVMVVEKELGEWKLLNALSHMAAFIGNKMPDTFDTGTYFVTKDGVKLPRNSQFPIVVLSATKSQIRDLTEQAQKQGVLEITFTKDMIETTDDKKLEKMIGEQASDHLDYLGIGLFGQKSQLDEITKGLNLWGK
jgi:lysyl-tRNA synthetase class 2